MADGKGERETDPSESATYITVHSLEELREEVPELAGDGQLQQVILQSTDNLTDSVVLQVIRDTTGATTIYQMAANVSDQDLKSCIDDVMPASQNTIFISEDGPILSGTVQPANVSGFPCAEEDVL